MSKACFIGLEGGHGKEPKVLKKIKITSFLRKGTTRLGECESGGWALMIDIKIQDETDL